MNTDPTPAPRQAVVYRQYLQLQSIAARSFSGTLAGHLVLCLGFGLEGSELALAVTIAGGAFLGIEPDPKNLKTAVRNGSCDFMVNTLDEALRVLKNELRKHTPLSTGLLGQPDELLSAIVERGVQPDLIAGSIAQHPALATLLERGAQTIPPASLMPVTQQVIWTAATPQAMRRLDQLALEILPAEDHVSRQWLRNAPASFPRERVLDMTPEEHRRFQKSSQT